MQFRVRAYDDTWSVWGVVERIHYSREGMWINGVKRKPADVQIRMHLKSHLVREGESE